MGAGSAGTSNDSGGKDTKTPFGKASSTKTKTKFGYSKPKSTFSKVMSDGGLILSAIKNNPISKKTEEVNRKFYNEKVVPAGKSKAPNYETYMKDRLAGKTDAYGNPTPNQGGNDNNNQPVIVQKNVGGQTVQTTEAKVEEDKAKSEKEYDARITKKKGRTKNILTSAKGVTQTASNYSLGKKTLLGQVV